MKSQCPTKILLEGFSLGGQETQGLKAHVEACPSCQLRIQQWREEREAFLGRYPFTRLWDAVQARNPSSSLWQKWFGSFHRHMSLGTALATASLAGIMALALWLPNQPPILRSKGGVSLGYFVSKAGGSEITLGKDKMKISPNSDLQFVYRSKTDEYLILFGIEANGALSVYYPQGGDLSTRIAPSPEKRQVPHAIRWQPTSDYERFFAVFSDHPISRQEIELSLQNEVETGKSAGKSPKKSIEELTRFPLPYPQSSILIYREKP